MVAVLLGGPRLGVDRPITVDMPSRHGSVSRVVDEDLALLPVEEAGTVGGAQVVVGQDLLWRAGGDDTS